MTDPMAAMQQPLDAIWERSKEDIAERVEAIESAAIDLLAGALSLEARHHACREAHKLGGVLYFLLAYGYGMLLSLGTLLLEEMSFQRYRRISDRFVLIGWALLENLGYRQLTVTWRLRGIWKYLRGRKDWGAMERRGLSRPTDLPAPGPST